MSVLLLPTCPTGCDETLAEALYNDCAPEYHWGEIEYIFFARPSAASFTNVDQLAEWTARLSQDSADPDAIRQLHVMGELPEPEQSELTVTGDSIVYGFKQFSIPFDVHDTNDTNYLFLLTNECNIKYKMWYQTADGMLYGGNDGITVSLKMNNVIPLGREDITSFKSLAKWKSRTSPLRCTSPMA